MTVEGRPDIARDVMAQSRYAWVFFVAYLLIATFMVLNLFIAVVVNVVVILCKRYPLYHFEQVFGFQIREAFIDILHDEVGGCVRVWRVDGVIHQH